MLIEFYASWCAPCKVLEAQVLTDPRVHDALERFDLLKLDTDEEVETSDHYGIVGLPTMIVLDPDGAEIYRVEGLIEADELARELQELAMPASHRSFVPGR